MANTPFLETDRLLLRRFTADDADDVFHIYGDERVNRFLPWFPLRSRAEAVEYLRREILPEYQLETAYRYAIELRETRRVAGYVTLNGINPAEGSGDLGYGLAGEYWSRGIVTEACRAVLAQVKKDGFRYVTATHDIDNPASGRVMRKLGMSLRHTYEEIWRPKLLRVTFALYRIDF